MPDAQAELARAMDTEKLRARLGVKTCTVLNMASSDSTLEEIGEYLGFGGQYAARMAGKAVRDAVAAERGHCRGRAECGLKKAAPTERPSTSVKLCMPLGDLRWSYASGSHHSRRTFGVRTRFVARAASDGHPAHAATPTGERARQIASKPPMTTRVCTLATLPNPLALIRLEFVARRDVQNSAPVSAGVHFSNGGGCVPAGLQPHLGYSYEFDLIEERAANYWLRGGGCFDVAGTASFQLPNSPQRSSVAVSGYRALFMAWLVMMR